jgi:hypothetical protein
MQGLSLSNQLCQLWMQTHPIGCGGAGAITLLALHALGHSVPASCTTHS